MDIFCQCFNIFTYSTWEIYICGYILAILTGLKWAGLSQDGI